uniref:Uncharacterized protein n=2 Tax=Anguilla anguilla TaxID=7936 RepID=A0A0E9ULN0_ANGAN
MIISVPLDSSLCQCFCNGSSKQECKTYGKQKVANVTCMTVLLIIILHISKCLPHTMPVVRDLNAVTRALSGLCRCMLRWCRMTLADRV